MDVGYAALMSQKEAEEREQFGPRPSRKKKNDYETKWRTWTELYLKVQAIAAVEQQKSILEGGPEDVEISVNAQVNYIVDQFVRTYEKKFGPLPDAKDEAALKRYARAAESK